MRTIIKAILRFFGQSKLSFIGLFLLTFFSSATFTTLNNTTINLQSSYEKISTEGNLHNFVINENYRYGQGPYSLNTNISNDTTSAYNGTLNITNISSPTTQDNISTYLVTFELNENAILSDSYEWTYAYKKIYDLYKSNSLSDDEQKEFSNFITFQSSISSSESTINSTNWNSNDEFITNAENIITNKKIYLDSFVESKYKNIYLTELENKFNVNVRDFNSLNINNTKQNIFYKLIDSSPEFTIDKLVIYEGNNLQNPWNVNLDDYNNYSKTDYENNPSLSRNLVPYLYKAKWSSSDINFDKLYEYTKENENYNPYTNKNNGSVVLELVNQSSIIKSILNNNGISTKGYSITFTYQKAGLVPNNGVIEDFSSYEIVVSPQYLEKMNKKPINYEEWTNHKTDKQEVFDNWLKTEIPDENKIYIDNQVFVIVGSGVSPDFMYPILSFENVVPNNEIEQVVYANQSGYEKMVDSFRGNEQENFLVGIFNAPESEWSSLLSKINTFTEEYMGWPSNINAAYLYDDISNTFSPTALRLQFIPNIVLTITTVSAFLTSFIVLLSIFISVVIIQRFIQTNRNSLGIMQANGYKKWEIITGVCALISIPVAIATIFGYSIGFGVQKSAIKLLENFWTLPTSIEPFSLVVMIPLLFIAISMFLIVTIAFTWFSLRGETAEFMKDDAKYKPSKLSELMKKPFAKFNIITRFRAAIAFTSLWRILILSVMSAGLMMSLTFSLDVLNTFGYASQKTYGSKNYSYSLNLLTPTLQSGQYYAVPYESQGETINKNIYFNTEINENTNIDEYKNNQYISQLYFDKSSKYYNYLNPSSNSYNPIFEQNVLKYGNYQLVSDGDLTEQNSNLMYLKNKSTVKAFADLNLGLGNLSTNPWSIGIRLMPPNNATYANQAFTKLFSLAASDNETLINIGKKASSTSKYTETINGVSYELNTYYQYIKSFCKVFAVIKDDVGNDIVLPNPSIDGVTDISVVTQDEINSNESAFYDEIDSLNNQYYDYYFQFNNSKIAGNGNSIIQINTTTNIYYLNLLYDIYSNSYFKDYTYSINYGKMVLGNEEINGKTIVDSQYTYVNFNVLGLNNYSKDITDSFNCIGLGPSEEKITLYNNKNQIINSKLWDVDYFDFNGYEAYPIIINEYASEVYDLSIGDTLKISINNSADRYSRKHFKKDNPIAYFKIVDITTTYQGPEFYMSQYDANKILGLTINNIKPKVPTSEEQITDTVSWSIKENNTTTLNVEYDYGNSYLFSSEENVNITSLPKKSEFIPIQSGFNGVFSESVDNLKEVTGGVSLYSPSGIYPGVDKIDKNNSTLQKIMTTSGNLEKTIEITGFEDLRGSQWEDVINEIANVFGTSASFSIISSASSKNSTLNVLDTISETATNIQNIVLSIIIIITVIIVVIISSIIINDSIKLAAILKCLGLADRNNALSFLSVYFPVFFIGLILSIPLSILLSYIYTQVILGFSGILLVINPIWWHYVISAMGVILIFALSYWTAWNKISKMNLTKSIK